MGKAFIRYTKKPTDFLYSTLKEAQEDCDESEIAAEIEYKIVKKYKQGGWLEIKQRFLANQ